MSCGCPERNKRGFEVGEIWIKVTNVLWGVSVDRRTG